MSQLEPYVAKLFIYPIKSLDSLNCDLVTILSSGALQDDRAWALFNESNNFVNAKRYQQIHTIRSEFHLATKNLILQIEGQEQKATFNLMEDQENICAWLKKHLGFPLSIKQNSEMGFPDDTDSPGPTIISTATLEKIASWYPELQTEDIRRRFRANIEIGGVPAFWEDRLFTDSEQTVKFQVGDVEFMGVNPCQRCIVVTRDPHTGEPYPKFQKIFIDQRKQTLPDWTERSRFNHFFRLAVNTKLAATEAGKIIKLEDKVISLAP